MTPRRGWRALALDALTAIVIGALFALVFVTALSA
jgi:hypothetical protein